MTDFLINTITGQQQQQLALSQLAEARRARSQAGELASAQRELSREELGERIMENQRQDEIRRQQLELQRQGMQPTALGAPASALLSGLFPDLNLTPEQLTNIPQELIGVLIQAMMGQAQMQGRQPANALFGSPQAIYGARRQRVE